jgi:hypothetical protein
MWTHVARVFAVIALGVAVAAHPSGARQSTDAPEARALLDQYLRGEFDAVVRTLTSFDDFSDLADDLEANAPGWIAAGSAESRARRELAAATVALEASRLGQSREWKHVQRIEIIETGYSRVFLLVYWRPPARLLEWGCALLRERPSVDAGERWWHLASLAVAERAQDGEFLVGLYAPPPDYLPAKIEHAGHLQNRLPAEPRVKLAIGIGQDVQAAGPAARETFSALRDDPDVGAEASVRLGAVMLRQGATTDAVAMFERAESHTRDPWVLYLARFFKGRALELRKRPADAERAYRSALRAMPHAQSGVMALATLLAKDGRRREAASLTADMLAAPPMDPWRAFADADDRFWPELIARVRAEIHP